MATVVLKKLGTDTIPVMDFGTYGGALSILLEDVFDYWVCDVDNIKDSDMDPEDIAGALELIEEEYDGHEAFDAQVLRLAPAYIQQALDEYGIAAKVVPGSCHWYHPREYNFFIPNTVSELEELLDPEDRDYWKVVAAIVRYFVDQDPKIADDVTEEMVEYISGNPDYATFSMYGIY